MDLSCGINQLEIIAKLVMHGFRAIPNDLEPTASLGRPGPKGSHDNMAARLDTAIYRLHVAMPIVRSREKVKDRSIMPQVVEDGWQIHPGDVGFYPSDGRAKGTKAVLSIP
jgi:hypothetical protein